MSDATPNASSTNTNAAVPKPNDECILVEIVSALNVPNVEKKQKEPDPFVVVEMAGQQVHKTDVLYNTQFPIWSLECGSLFLVDPTVDQTVTFVLKEYESWRKDPTLGFLVLPIDEMKKGKGKRREYPLVVPQNVIDLTQSEKRTIVRKVREWK